MLLALRSSLCVFLPSTNFSAPIAPELTHARCDLETVCGVFLCFLADVRASWVVLTLPLRLPACTAYLELESLADKLSRPRTGTGVAGASNRLNRSVMFSFRLSLDRPSSHLQTAVNAYASHPVGDKPVRAPRSWLCVMVAKGILPA